MKFTKSRYTIGKKLELQLINTLADPPQNVWLSVTVTEILNECIVVERDEQDGSYPFWRVYHDDVLRSRMPPAYEVGES